MSKPLDGSEIEKAGKTEDQDESACLRTRAQRLEGIFEDKLRFTSKAKAMDRVNEALASLRRETMRGGEVSESRALILGEKGSAKEGIARMIHLASRSGKGPWLTVNCSQASEQELEVELFGREEKPENGKQDSLPGVFIPGVFRMAAGGTVFLDEVEKLPQGLQTKLLRAFLTKSYRPVNGKENRELNARVLAGAGSDIKSKVMVGKFLDGLLQQFSQVTLEIPPLRERPEDILAIGSQFAERSFREHGRVFDGFSPAVEKQLRDYSWPGNEHELLCVIERLALTSNQPFSVSSPSEEHETNVIAMPGRGDKGAGASGEIDVSYTALKRKWTDSFEKDYLVVTLNRNHGNVSAAAREAKIDRSNFLRLLRKHGLKSENYRKGSGDLEEIKAA